MPLDHYVSQVHLKQFYSPKLGELMYALRKSDLKTFTPNSESVCRITDGNTNPYLHENRAVEEFLKSIEPKYNSALAKVVERKIDSECIYTIAGFVAYISTCSPTAMRLHTGPIKSVLNTTATILDENHMFPPIPDTLGATSITELLNNGSIKMNVNQKYPQALGISGILEIVKILGNSIWEILYNNNEDSLFFTSDFPAAIEIKDNSNPFNKITPLSPRIAIRIIPDIYLEKEKLDFSFNKFRCRFRNIGRQEVVKLNCLIVRCAEETVFYQNELPWIKPFITKNRHYRIEPLTDELKTESGTFLISRQKIIATNK